MGGEDRVRGERERQQQKHSQHHWHRGFRAETKNCKNSNKNKNHKTVDERKRSMQAMDVFLFWRSGIFDCTSSSSTDGC